jgi:Contractile injection system spike tip protein
MSNSVIFDGDQALFLPTFGAATVTVRPGQLVGTSGMSLAGKKACVIGDALNVTVVGCTYTTSKCSIPGTGTLSIDSLAPNQIAKQTTVGGKALLLQGGSFNARFQVQSAAMQPPTGLGSPIPDSTRQYSGTGKFMPKNPSLITS